MASIKKSEPPGPQNSVLIIKIVMMTVITVSGTAAETETGAQGKLGSQGQKNATRSIL